MKKVTVALAGIPNVGKSTIFNALTGGKAWVGNWPGVTVEKKVGRFRVNGFEVEVVDLPGVYSLTAYSTDELVARNFLVDEKPDVVVCILSAVSLSRSLYLALSILEMKANMVIALNMVDLAAERGVRVDPGELSKALGVPVIETIASKGVGIKELKKAIVERAKNPKHVEFRVDYGPLVEAYIERVVEVLPKDMEERISRRWIAIKLIEGDPIIRHELAKQGLAEALSRADAAREAIRKTFNVDPEEYIVSKRMNAAESIARRCAKVVAPVSVKEAVSDAIDSVVTHPVLGVLVLLSALYMMFYAAFQIVSPLVHGIAAAVSALYGAAQASPLPADLKSLLCDGVINGVGAVLVFTPSIAAVFIFLSFLEDLGYMTRAGFVVDKYMSKIGLSGKSLIPLLLGIGCNVPAVLACRTLEDEDTRKVTALVCPLVPCSARLPIFLVFAAAFFAAWKSFIVLSLYLIGFAAALLAAPLLRRALGLRESAGFAMELPPYIIPSARNVLLKAWERTRKFLEKAGTVILLGSVAAWFLSATGPAGWIGSAAMSSPSLLERSWIGLLGHALSIVFAPMGWDWRACAALILGFVTKELVVSALAVLYGVGEAGLLSILPKAFTFTSAYAYLLFVLLYTPCLATVAAIRSELGWKYALLSVVFQITLAYAASLAFLLAARVIVP